MIRLMVATFGFLALADAPPAPAPDTYEQRKAAAGRDAASQVDLALWCEAHGLERERLRHLAVAVLSEPSNAMARGLMGLVEYRGKWRRPEAVADAVKADMKQADLMAEYAGRRVRTPVKPDAQYKLALWSEEKGLKDEARAHFATVVRLDPKHAEAWKRLGYKKAGDRWVTGERASAEKAERQAQQEADKHWRPRLERLREALDGKGQRKDDAQRELGTITDPHAVPAVWHAFVERGGNHQIEAVQLLGQIDAIEASRALATLAVSAKSGEVRRRATETLRRRDPREWADLLIVMLREKIKYEVKHVAGPGSSGELYVEGKKQNLKRLYSPPPVPFIPFLPGDTIERDEHGQPVLVHHRLEPWMNGTPLGPNPLGMMPIVPNLGGAVSPSPGTARANGTGADRLRGRLPAGVASDPVSLSQLDMMFDPIAQGQLQASMDNSNLYYNSNSPALFQQAARMTDELHAMDPSTTVPRNRWIYVPGGGVDRQVRVPFGKLMAEARRVASGAEGQLQADVAALERYNAGIIAHNRGIVAILESASRTSIPPEPEPWRAWFIDQLGYQRPLITPDEVPTVVENVPLQDRARPVPIEYAQGPVFHLERRSCFGEGTLVRALDGPRQIEDLKVGDLVLTQDTKTGKLGYRPITVVHHNPPSPTYDIRLGSDTIVSSHFHRFWVAGRGWVMARDLKEGDPVRTLGGVAKVTKIEPGKVQLVYNLDVEGDADFFAGSVAALVHDNSLPDLKQQPFDAPKAVAAN